LYLEKGNKNFGLRLKIDTGNLYWHQILTSSKEIKGISFNFSLGYYSVYIPAINNPFNLNYDLPIGHDYIVEKVNGKKKFTINGISADTTLIDIFYNSNSTLTDKNQFIQIIMRGNEISDPNYKHRLIFHKGFKGFASLVPVGKFCVGG
jgi:hypothetical protein